MLDEYIEWDVDEEKQKNKKNAEKILKNFHDVECLEDVLVGVQSLMDSDIYEKFYEASEKDPEEMTYYVESADELLKLRQVKLASEILKNPPLYVASLTGVIIFSHFQALFAFIGGINYVHTQKKLNRNSTMDEHIILERIMSLLDTFDKPVSFQPPDEEFYRKLKDIKWDKRAQKIYKKILGIIRDITLVRWGTKSSTFGNGEHRLITFLAACSAVNQDRGKILPEDVIVAHRTFLKLLDTDITKMGVL